MASLTERLALLVTLDANGAIRGFNDLGRAADRNLSKTDQRLDLLGSRFQKAGAGAAAFGALAIVGLGKAAKASEDAHLSVVKLENSLRGNRLLAGETAQSFIDLAQAIQSKTAADGDAIVAGQAMLATFRVTGDQIRGLTPLVVDYSRKFGVDMVAANAAVGKALDGSIGALKRNGVSIDEALFKTDRYAAVTQALRDQVGGFAEAEGKTFAGSLERAKNELGDLVEGVGTGAVEAFQALLGPVHGLSEAMTSLDPGLQSVAGKTLTFGAAGLTAAGGVAFVAGKAIELRDSIKDIPNRLSNLGRGLGGLKGGAGLAAGAVGIFAIALFKAKQRSDDLRQAARELADEAERTGKSLEDVALTKLAKTFAESDQVSEAMRELQVSFADLRGPLQGSRDDFDEWADALLAADNQIGGTGRLAGVLVQRVATLRDELGEAQQVTARTAEATRALGSAADDSVDPLASAAEGVSSLGANAKDAATPIAELRTRFNELTDSLNKSISADFAYEDAIADTVDALKRLAEAKGIVIDKDTTQAEKTEAVAQATRNARDALLTQAQAAADAAAEAFALADVNLTAAQKQQVFRDELTKLTGDLQAGSALRIAIDEVISRIDHLAQDRRGSLTLEIRESRLSIASDKLLGPSGGARVGATSTTPTTISPAAQSAGSTSQVNNVTIINPTQEPASTSIRKVRGELAA